MRLSSEELKELYQQQTARSARPGADCPGAERLLQLAEGELSREERERVADHLVACSDCAHEYRIISSAGHSQERAAGVSFFSSSRARALAVAAMVLIAAVASVIPWQMSRPADSTNEAVRGGREMFESVDPQDGGVLDEAPRQLSWAAAEQAEDYQVLVYDHQSTPIWESGPTSSTAITLPEEVRQKLARGQPVYWRVVIQRGVDRRRSKLFQFTIR